jgi:hypothetical protein
VTANGQVTDKNMNRARPNKEMKALGLAMAGATIASVATMFVPTALLESATGATGLSEIIPAAAAPLGDTARALIAFGAGVLTLAVLALLLLRQPLPTRKGAFEGQPADDDEAGHGMTAKLRDRLSAISLPRLPWSKEDDDITDLADLPRLRTGDVHPDAPPRRPLSAGTDLPVLELVEIEPQAEVQRPLIETPDAEKAADPVEQLLEPALQGKISSQNAESEVEKAQPTLADMVAQLEQAVAERKRQLEALERVALDLSATHHSVEVAEQFQHQEDASPRPRLEAINSKANDDGMDSALEAALATLHRMSRAS